MRTRTTKHGATSTRTPRFKTVVTAARLFVANPERDLVADLAAT